MVNVGNILNEWICLVSEVVNSLDVESETIPVAVQSFSQENNVNVIEAVKDPAQSKKKHHQRLSHKIVKIFLQMYPKNIKH